MWNKQKPTQTGFYWLKNIRIEGDTGIDETPVIVHVYKSFDGLLDVTFTGNDCSFSMGEIAEGDWWSELIKVPE